MTYQAHIKEYLARHGRSEIDPRHVEAWIRNEHSTLDALSRPSFRLEIVLAVQCIDETTRDSSEQLARSFGL